MSVKEIEAAITELSAEELAELAAWFASYHNSHWDRRIEQDLDEGRLDAFLSEVEAEYQSGKAKPL